MISEKRNDEPSAVVRRKETPDAVPEAETLSAMRRFLETHERERKEGAAAVLDSGIDKRLIEEAAEEAEDDRERELWLLFSRLPERLQFQPGITLVIGENGSGKSTLAKALYLAVMENQRRDYWKTKAAEAVTGGKRIDSEEGKWFTKADQMAEKDVYSSNQDEQRVFIRQAGLAPRLSRAMQLDDAYSSAEVQYGDFHSIVGTLKANDRGVMQDEQVEGYRGIDRRTGAETFQPMSPIERDRHRRESAERAKRFNKRHGSTRQAVDRLAQVMIHGNRPTHGPSIFFLDEPESGLSPFRHERIEELIDTMIDSPKNPASISVVPTNSTKLYESDLPRIDLRYPERGIFRPSQYPDYFER